MARGDQLGRQWKILQMLIDAKTGRSVADMQTGWNAIPGRFTGILLPSRPRDFQEQLFQVEKTNTDWYRIVAS